MKRSPAIRTAPPGCEGAVEGPEGQDNTIVWLTPGQHLMGESANPARFRRPLGPLERELHDTVLQDLLCISMGLHSVRGTALDEATRQEVIHLQEVAQQAYTHLRELLNGKAETSAPPQRMRDVLANCVRAFNLKSGAGVELEVHDSAGSLCVSGEVVHQAEMIVHEALCNAWRHGRARSIKVVLTETADIVWVKILDDGKGFDSSVRKPGHYGLRIMRERADAIGARLGITSTLGKGTCVNLYLPSHHSTVSTN